MTVNDFIAQFRRDLDDTEPPHLWSDADIIRYMNGAVREACERALLIEDSTGAAAQLDTIINQPIYALHTSVIKIKRVKVRGIVLEETSVEAEDACRSNWEALVGQPRRFIAQDLGIRLVPTPDTAEVVALTVYRRPLAEFNVDPALSGALSPEFNQIYHERLLDWIYRCAYLKQDSEALNKSKAVEYEALFTQSFGARPDANVQRKRRDKRPPLVQMVW